LTERATEINCPPVTLQTYAQQVLQAQFLEVVGQEEGVAADQDPKYLHKMRVGMRRLRTALQVFGRVVALPLSEKRVRSLGRQLGALRDLDVQLAELNSYYLPRLTEEQRPQLVPLLLRLGKKRRRVLRRVRKLFHGSSYQKLKQTCLTWVEEPTFQAGTARPLQPLVPYLLYPLLSQLVQHPAWLLGTELTPAQNLSLHELRKEIKHVRYQMEFFSGRYGPEFKDWVKSLKKLQDVLGILQDIHVLTELIAQEVPALESALHKRRLETLAAWDSLRQPYLDAVFLGYLGKMIAQPL
jgi:CHAD domain-containing protein